MLALQGRPLLLSGVPGRPLEDAQAAVPGDWGIVKAELTFAIYLPA